MLRSTPEGRRARAAHSPLLVSTLLLGAVALASASCSAPEADEGLDADPTIAPSELGIPRPTENWLDEDAEQSQSSRRKAWFEERHGGAPDVDWRAIERANGLAQMEKRNALAVASQRASGVASPWVERGSENQAGRMFTAVYSSDGAHLYAGSSLGGVWRGSPAGDDWTPIGDNLAGGVHRLAVVAGESPGDPDVVLAAQDGGSMRVSFDDGASWLPPNGIPSINSLRRVLVASDGSDAVFVLAMRGSAAKLWRSLDRMQSFTAVRTFSNFLADAWMDRAGGSELIVVDGIGVARSTDLGTTWTNVGTLPSGSTEVDLAGCEAGAPRLWGVFARNGANELHRSDDLGATWTYLRDTNDYWGELSASTTDPNLFAWGGVEMWRTGDGGLSFAKVNSWGAYYGNPAGRLHADIRGIEVWPLPAGGEAWYVATDGGLYRSDDGLATVSNLSLQGLRVSQYYSTLTSSANPLHVAAGSQDQGYQWASAPAPPDGTRLDFDQLISGDYGHVTSADGSHALVYSTYPGFILVQIGENAPSLKQVSFPAGETNNAWLPPVVAEPTNVNQFFFLGTHLWKYRRNGTQNTWSEIQWSAQDFETTSGEYLSALDFSPLDPDRAYAATNRGRLWFSNDRGVTWTLSASLGPRAHYFYGTALLASATDVDTVWVGGSGYGVPAVYRSTDGGLTFQEHSTGLPDTLVYCLGEAPDGSGDIFCGTETAAYRRDAGAASWADITSNEAPITIYWSVEAHPAENTMRFGTYGRGIWDYQIDPQARALAYNGSGVNASCFASVSLPELGGAWSVSVDSGVRPGATLSGFVVYPTPSSGSLLGSSEVLVDLTSQRLLSAVQAASGAIDTFAFAVPNDPTFAGLQSYAQGFVIGAGFELCNALELVLGY